MGKLVIETKYDIGDEIFFRGNNQNIIYIGIITNIGLVFDSLQYTVLFTSIDEFIEKDMPLEHFGQRYIKEENILCRLTKKLIDNIDKVYIEYKEKYKEEKING